MIEFGPGYRGVSLPQIARIDETACIGCVKCIRACPVDAIVGAARQMHTVITADCTGCELCLSPCPVDCIRMVPASESAAERQARSSHFRHRYQRRQARLATQAGREEAARETTAMTAAAPGLAEKKRYIQAAVERSRRRSKPPSR